MSYGDERQINDHELNVWQDREGDIIGASIFLTPEEVKQLREENAVEIKRGV